MKKFNVRPPRPEDFEPLDEEERELMEAEERGEFKPVPPEEFKILRKKLMQAAKNSIRARKMISIKVRQDDLELLKKEAEKRGIGYQTLINSILHQFAIGQIKNI